MSKFWKYFTTIVFTVLFVLLVKNVCSPTMFKFWDYVVFSLIGLMFGFFIMLGIDLIVWCRKPENNLPHQDFKYDKRLEDK